MAKKKNTASLDVDMVVRAVRKLLQSHTDKDKLLEALSGEKKHWAPLMKEARADFTKALSEAQLDGNETQAQRDAFNEIRTKVTERDRATQNAKGWATKRDSADAELVKLIENTAPGKCAALAEIAAAYQALQEAKAGRAAALQPLLTDLDELEAKMKKQVNGAVQLGLFD